MIIQIAKESTMISDMDNDTEIPSQPIIVESYNDSICIMGADVSYVSIPHHMILEVIKIMKKYNP